MFLAKMPNGSTKSFYCLDDGTNSCSVSLAKPGSGIAALTACSRISLHSIRATALQGGRWSSLWLALCGAQGRGGGGQQAWLGRKCARDDKAGQAWGFDDQPVGGGDLLVVR